jgi:hypothetical protein
MISENQATPRKPVFGQGKRLERTLRPLLRDIRMRIKAPLLSVIDPEALRLYERTVERAYLPNDLIDVAPKLNLIYLAVPKAASSRIRSNLASMLGNDTETGWRSDQNWRVHKRNASGLQAPRHGLRQFNRLAHDPSALRFTFVRNPYSRLLSCWADQYRGHALVPGYGRVDVYLKHRERADLSLPVGPQASLSFEDFVRFACASADWRIDKHWQVQSDIVESSGIAFDLVGKTESFNTDFSVVLDHVKASAAMRESAIAPFHTSSRRGSVSDHFTQDMAKLVQKAYERDFDAFGYARDVPT